jgi:hypothetical protein
MARQKHEPTEERQRMVKSLISRGMPRATIAEIIGVTAKTLDRCYRVELETGADHANAQVAGKLFAQCMADKFDMPHTTARIFWLKARGKWRDQAIEHVNEDGATLPDRSGPAVLILPDDHRNPHMARPMKVIEHVKVAA